MKSYFVELTDIGKSHLNSEDIDTSKLLDNEAIIKAEYSLISAGTELSRAFALKKGFKYPVRPGYSLVGKVLEKGKGLDLNIGDRVYVNAAHASIIRHSNESKAQKPFIIKLDDRIDPIHATILNLGLVAIQGVNLTDVKLNDTVAVFGLGNLGILIALMYKKMGCKVIGVDIVKERCKLAKQMGIEYIIDDTNQLEKLNELTNNKLADIVVDVSGLSEVIITCIKACKAYGQVLLLGSPRQSYETNITEVFSDIHMKNIKVIGGFNSTTPHNQIEGSNINVLRNFDIVSEMIINKDIDVSKLISKVIDPKDCEKAYYDLMYNKDQVNCIVFDWNNY